MMPCWICNTANATLLQHLWIVHIYQTITKYSSYNQTNATIKCHKVDYSSKCHSTMAGHGPLTRHSAH